MIEIFPVKVIDEEIYKEPPSVLIGTIDKFVQIFRKPNLVKNLFGLTNSLGPPDLIIQDELHLISGPLGSLTGLYELAIDELCSTSAGPAKIIGSTATIRRAEDQIRSLYNRTAFQFPPAALDAENSGFAKTDNEKTQQIANNIIAERMSAMSILFIVYTNKMSVSTSVNIKGMTT